MPKNIAARVSFILWIVAIAVFVGAVGAGIGIATTGTGEMDGLSVLVFPILASFAYTPLLLIGVIIAVAALRQPDRAKTLAVIALVLNILGFLLSTVVFVTALGLYS